MSRRLQCHFDVPCELSNWLRRSLVKRMNRKQRSEVRANQRQPVFKVSRPNAQLLKNHRVRRADSDIFGCDDTVSEYSYVFSVNVQKKEDSNISVLMRIMTNYLQMITATLAFNLKFPNYFASLLSSVKQVGGSSGVFLSFDCFLMNTRATEIFNNVSYLKVM